MNTVLLDLVRDGYIVRLYSVSAHLMAVTLTKSVGARRYSVARFNGFDTPDEHWAFDLSQARDELERAVLS